MSVTIELLQRQNRELRETIEERDETIRQLRESIVPADALPIWAPKMTPTEEALLRVLLARDVATLAAFNSAVPQSADEYAEPYERLRVYMCRLRKLLSPIGVKIITVWGRGYQLDRQSADEAAARMQRFTAEATLQSQHTNSVSGGTAQPSQEAVQ